MGKTKFSLPTVTENNYDPEKLEEFWKLDTIGIKDCPIESDDEKALAHFEENIEFKDGRIDANIDSINYDLN